LKLEDLANAITDCEMELKESSCYSWTYARWKQGLWDENQKKLAATLEHMRDRGKDLEARCNEEVNT
jgi:hypothetical protein